MQFTAKNAFWSNNILCKSHEMNFVHPEHAFMPCWIAVEYVARVPHFNASSFIHINITISVFIDNTLRNPAIVLVQSVP